MNQGLSEIFGGSETADLLGSVIRSDRQRTGRSPSPFKDSPEPGPPAAERSPEPYDVMTGRKVIKEYDSNTIGQAGSKADKQTDNTASPVTSPIAVGEADKLPEAGDAEPPKGEPRRRAKREASELLLRRVSEATRMAESPTTTVTLRLPHELNDWLDEYVHRAWPERVRKQELVIEALRILFARRGRPGEPVLETELIPE